MLQNWYPRGVLWLKLNGVSFPWRFYLWKRLVSLPHEPPILQAQQFENIFEFHFSFSTLLHSFSIFSHCFSDALLDYIADELLQVDWECSKAVAGITTLFTSDAALYLPKEWNSFFCRPEPHILLFRRAIGTDPVTGKAPGQ
jgi:hypothetical protein